jgi:cell wall-associated NlpC family hydrolase
MLNQIQYPHQLRRSSVHPERQSRRKSHATQKRPGRKEVSEANGGSACPQADDRANANALGTTRSTNQPSFFDDFRAAKDFRKEALSWLGTPFREYYQQNVEAGRAQLVAAGIDADSLDVKGPGGGIDCVGLVQEIFARSGATDKWIFPRNPADYQSHQTGEKILDWLRGKGTSGSVGEADSFPPPIDPRSALLGKILVELEIPDAVTDPHAVTPRDFFKVGDICVMKHGSLFHMPVIIDNDLNFVNAIPRMGVIEGTIQDSSYSIHLVAVFRLLPLSSRAKSRDPANQPPATPWPGSNPNKSNTG